MERTATVAINFKINDIKNAPALDKFEAYMKNRFGAYGGGESTGLANDRRVKEQAEATKGLAKSMSDLASVAMTSGLAMTGFVAAASTDAIDTLWGSVKLLSGEIGKMFIPAVVSTSGYLQDAANWVRNMDEGAKGMISTVAGWTAGLSLAGFAIQKIGVFAMTAWDGLMKAGTAAKYLVAGLGPIPTIILGLTAAAAAFRIFGDSVDKAANRFNNLRDAMESGGFNSRRMSRREYELAIPEQVRNRIEAARPGERSGVINAEIERVQREQRENPANESAFAEMKEAFREIEENTWSFGSGLRRNWQRRNAINRIRQRHGMAGDVTGDVGEGSGTAWVPASGLAWNERDRELYAARYSGIEGRNSNNALLSGLRSVLNFGAPGSGPMVSNSFNSRQFSSAGGFYDVIAQKALSGDQMNKSLEQLQEDGNTLLARLAGTLAPEGGGPPTVRLAPPGV